MMGSCFGNETEDAVKCVEVQCTKHSNSDHIDTPVTEILDLLLFHPVQDL